MIVSGGDGGAVRIWDLESGAAVGKPLRGRDVSVISALALGERAGRAVIVSGGEDGTMRVWDMESGVAVGEPLRGHLGAVHALAFGKQTGRA